MNLQKNKQFQMRTEHLRAMAGCGYDEIMYKNTASPGEVEPLTQARVRRHGETDAQLRLQARGCARQGIKVMIFPDQATLEAWRVRVAALA